MKSGTKMRARVVITRSRPRLRRSSPGALFRVFRADSVQRARNYITPKPLQTRVSPFPFPSLARSLFFFFIHRESPFLSLSFPPSVVRGKGGGRERESDQSRVSGYVCVDEDLVHWSSAIGADGSTY